MSPVAIRISLHIRVRVAEEIATFALRFESQTNFLLPYVQCLPSCQIIKLIKPCVLLLTSRIFRNASMYSWPTNMGCFDNHRRL